MLSVHILVESYMEISGEIGKKEMVGKGKVGSVGGRELFQKKGKGTTGRGQRTGSHCSAIQLCIYYAPPAYQV